MDPIALSQLVQIKRPLVMCVVIAARDLLETVQYQEPVTALECPFSGCAFPLAGLGAYA
jgi:hypothetical protein